MFRYLFTTFFIFSLIVVFDRTAKAQTDSLEIEYGLESNNLDPTTAIPVIDSFLLKNPNTPRRAKIEYKLAELYAKGNQVEKAKELYLKIIESKRNDTAQISPDEMMEGDRAYMVNLRNYAAFNMAELYYAAKDYKTAIVYYKIGIYRFPFRHFSGSDINQHRVKEFQNLADAYAQSGQMDSALSVLLPFMFNPIVYSPRAVMKAAYLIMMDSTNHNWCSKFNTALATMKLTDTTMQFRLDSVLIKIPMVFHEFPNTSVTTTGNSEMWTPPKTASQAIKLFKDHQFCKVICKQEDEKK